MTEEELVQKLMREAGAQKITIYNAQRYKKMVIEIVDGSIETRITPYMPVEFIPLSFEDK